MFEGAGLSILLAAAGGAVAGNLLGFAAKYVDAFVRKTPTRLDDKVWLAVRGAMAEAIHDVTATKEPGNPNRNL